MRYTQLSSEPYKGLLRLAQIKERLVTAISLSFTQRIPANDRSKQLIPFIQEWIYAPTVARLQLGNTRQIRKGISTQLVVGFSSTHGRILHVPDGKNV